MEIRSSEELRELASSFNIMRLRLQEAMNEINASRQDLEAKVEECTKQLRIAYQKLMNTVQTRMKSESKSLLLEVSDNGDGTPEESISKIFHPFFTTKGKGTGVDLGLSVVYGIVESHSGDVEFKSVPGQGTTFQVSLLFGKQDPKLLHLGQITYFCRCILLWREDGSSPRSMNLPGSLPDSFFRRRKMDISYFHGLDHLWRKTGRFDARKFPG